MVHVNGSGLIEVLRLATPISSAVRFPISHCGRLYWFNGHPAASHPTNWAFDVCPKTARMIGTASWRKENEQLLGAMLMDQEDQSGVLSQR